MSGEFWAGVLTIPILAAAWFLISWLHAKAQRAWVSAHQRLISKIDLRENPRAIRFRGDPAPEPRPKYEDTANRMRDALLQSPRLYSGYGLGWMLIICRDYREAKHPVMDDDL
jgi:hypothetical protein